MYDIKAKNTYVDGISDFVKFVCISNILNNIEKSLNIANYTYCAVC